ncbi:hypothetical protein GCM10023188_15040 [Pontibacter saemangeumensis]|uniref:Uncharacterized protein n=1 Tax=Pontibacter saemangeumensis TaxID=1084525 RepID=A0ABP8LI98_9BACT
MVAVGPVATVLFGASEQETLKIRNNAEVSNLNSVFILLAALLYDVGILPIKNTRQIMLLKAGDFVGNRIE